MNSGRRFDSSLLQLVVALPLLALITGCGGKQNVSPPSTTTSSGTGSVSFTAEWEPPPDARAAPTATGIDLLPMGAAIYVCDDYGIQTVTLKVLPSDNVLDNAVVESVPIPCTDNQGTVRNVPAGTGYYMLVEGRLTLGGTPSWRGLGGPFSVTVGQNTDIGKVTVSYVGTDSQAPSVLSISPADNTTNVPDNSAIRIRFSEKMAINTVQDNAAVVVTDNISGPVPGTITYNASDNSATFTPSSPLTSGAKVTVTVTGDVATDMAGRTLGSAHSSAFHTRFRGQWGIPVQIENIQGSSGNYGAPYVDVSLNGNGDVFAVWQETIGNPIFVYSSRYLGAENRWTTPLNLSRSGDQYSGGARVAADDFGNAIAVWRSGNWIIAGRYSSSSGSWAAPLTLNDNQGNGGNPAIAVDNNGNGVVSYVANDADIKAGIYLSNYSRASDYWSKPYSSSAGSNCVGGIYINKIATMIDYYDPQYNRTMIVYSCDNGIFSQFNYNNNKLGDGLDYYYNNKGVDLSARGFKAVVVWDNNDGLWSNFFDGSAPTTDLLWSGPKKIHTAGGSPSVLMNDSGDVVVVWGGGNANVYASHATFAGKQWSNPPINLSGTPPLGSEDTRLGMDKDGNAMAIWAQLLLGGYQILLSKRYDAGTKKWDASAENIVKNNESLSLGYSTFNMSSNGNAVALWYQIPAGGVYPPQVHANFWYK